MVGDLRTGSAAGPAVRAGDPCTGVVGPRSLTVCYDQGCELCRRCRAWLEVQATWVPIRFVAADAAEAAALLPQVPWLGTELVVIGDGGETWIGPAAFLTCLWATRRYRGWSHRLAGPSFAPLAERFFEVVSSNRGKVAAALRSDACDDGTCRHRPAAPFAGPPDPGRSWGAERRAPWP